MKKFNVKAKVIREVFHNGDFRILAILPLEKTDLELNRYGNCTITGELGYLDVDKEYTFVLCEGKASKYGMSYNVLDVPSMKLKDLKELTYEEKYEILRDCTSSDRIATNILEAYPDYIELVVENGAEVIDTSKVKGMGEVYNKAYTRTLVSKFKYYTLCHNEKLKPYEITIKEAKDLYSVHAKTEDIIKAFKENPYYELIEICGRSLSRTDKLLRTVRPDLIDSTQRTEALLMEILKRNEYDGNTRLNGSVLYSVVKNDDNYVGFKNLISKLKDVASESELIYFDDKSCDLSLMSTYIAECNVNSFVREKIKESPIIDDSLIEKYRNLDGSELSDEQLNAVRNFNKYSFTLLTGSAGCVDKDTEFFNGYEWKKISDYNENDMVLQYNTKKLKAELIKPYTYIKLPETEWILIKNKYGKIIQQLSPDHIATIFDTKTGNIIDCNIIKAISKFDKNKIEKHRYYFLGDNNATDLKEVEYIDYTEKGYKYCFKVPSEHLLLRKNNYTFITHNCGKTFVTKAIIDFCDDNHLSYTLLAPTGSASLRLKESTGRDAMTIHLKCLKDGAIKTDVLLVDESSMVDLPTFNMMLNCIENPDIRICLVGDKSQILPVGIGCVFADMINSKKVPLTELTKVFRYNDNGILYMATNTRQGRYCLEDKNVTHRKDDYTIGGTYHFSEVGGKDIDAKILERVTDRYFNLLKRGIRQKDILILSAYNVGECGVDKINNVIQAEVNPPSTAKKEFLIGKHTIIRVGDRVINIKNDYKALTMECYEKLKESNGMLSEEDLEDTTTIFNGQRGVAVDVLDDGKALVCSFDNEIIVFTKMKAKNIKLAYAISYHKSQGQESPYVISVVTPNQSRLLNRNLLYVGQTRGKKEQFDIGSIEAMKNALSIDGVERRDTWLYDLLRESEV